jgi:hypothetical protein
MEVGIACGGGGQQDIGSQEEFLDTSGEKNQ